MTTSNTDIYVYLGGTRSGKSMFAEQKVYEIAKGGVIYVATAQIFDQDLVMQQRINTHKQRRPSHWEVIECPLQLATTLRLWLQKQQKSSQKSTLLLDCVTLWISNILLATPGHDAPILSQETLRAFEAAVRQEITDILHLSQEFSAQWVFVSGEVGLGGIGASALERTFQDGLGLANQLLVAQSTEAYLAIAGRKILL